MGRRIGDRKDGSLLRDIDALHYITAILYPNRCDNEAFISEILDLTKTEEWIRKQNELNPEFHYTVFQVIVSAVLKTILLRPKMNRFIANSNMYQRNDVCASFIVKKVFSDDGGEGLAKVTIHDQSTIFTIHEDIFRQISKCHHEKSSGSSEDSMDFFSKLPRFISKNAVKFIMMLDRHGKVPQFLIEDDPYYSSVVLSNLGSLKLHAGYHHLTNWGTTSVFCVVGEIKKRIFHDPEKGDSIRRSVDFGLTVDERLADGYYYSKTVRLLKKLVENPELLEKPFSEGVEI